MAVWCEHPAARACLACIVIAGVACGDGSTEGRGYQRSQTGEFCRVATALAGSAVRTAAARVQWLSVRSVVVPSWVTWTAAAQAYPATSIVLSELDRANVTL